MSRGCVEISTAVLFVAGPVAVPARLATIGRSHSYTDWMKPINYRSFTQTHRPAYLICHSGKCTIAYLICQSGKCTIPYLICHSGKCTIPYLILSVILVSVQFLILSVILVSVQFLILSVILVCVQSLSYLICHSGKCTIPYLICHSGKYAIPNTSLWSQVISGGGTPVASSRSFWTRSGWDTPLDLGWGTPLLDLGQGTLPQTWDRVLPLDLRWRNPLDLRWDTPWTWDEVPPLTRSGLDRAAQRVLATRRAVCLLHSRRRTFLLVDIFGLSY